MKCPYCISEIPHEALVCAVCRRDLFIVRPLLQRITALEAELAALPAQLQQATSEESQLEKKFAKAEAREDNQKRSVPAAIGWWLSPLLLLIAAHGMMFFVYDLSVIYLRVFALIVPLPFGYLFARALRGPFVWGLPAAFLMAMLAIMGMWGISSLIDHVPFLPQNMADVREFIEFSSSISFSFITGLWLCHWQMRHDESKRLAVLRASLSKFGAVDGQKLTEKLIRLNDLGSGAVALLTTAFALYTGLKKIIG